MLTFRTLPVLLVAAAALGFAPASATGKTPMTHKVTITGELVNHWTIDEHRGECGRVGSGTLSMKFKTTEARRVKPYRNSYRPGDWSIVEDYGGHLEFMRPEKAEGTVTRIDDTTQQTAPPTPDGEPGCEPAAPRTGCGTFPLKNPWASANGYDNRSIKVDVGTGRMSDQSGRDTKCLSGQLDAWEGHQELFGGGKEGEVLLKMPKESDLRTKKVVTVTGKTRKKTSLLDPDYEDSTTDITRKATVTFTRR